MPTPAPEVVFASLGQVIGVAGPGDVQPHPTQRGGWGGSGDKIENVRVPFQLDGADVEVKTSPVDWAEAILVSHLVINNVRRRKSHRFPLGIVVEKKAADLAVDGNRIPFTIYTAGRSAVAVGYLADNVITIDCPTRVVRRLQLRSLTAEELPRFLGHRPHA